MATPPSRVNPRLMGAIPPEARGLYAQQLQRNSQNKRKRAGTQAHTTPRDSVAKRNKQITVTTALDSPRERNSFFLDVDETMEETDVPVHNMSPIIEHYRVRENSSSDDNMSDGIESPSHAGDSPYGVSQHFKLPKLETLTSSRDRSPYSFPSNDMGTPFKFQPTPERFSPSMNPAPLDRHGSNDPWKLRRAAHRPEEHEYHRTMQFILQGGQVPISTQTRPLHQFSDQHGSVHVQLQEEEKVLRSKILSSDEQHAVEALLTASAPKAPSDATIASYQNRPPPKHLPDVLIVGGQEYAAVVPKKKKKRKPRVKTPDDLYCRSCGTRDTPEWRKGPDGCKSLCNACGLHYAKILKREKMVSPASSSKQMDVNSLVD